MDPKIPLEKIDVSCCLPYKFIFFYTAADLISHGHNYSFFKTSFFLSSFCNKPPFFYPSTPSTPSAYAHVIYPVFTLPSCGRHCPARLLPAASCPSCSTTSSQQPLFTRWCQFRNIRRNHPRSPRGTHPRLIHHLHLSSCK